MTEQLASLEMGKITARGALLVAVLVAAGCSGVRSKPECPVPDGPACLSTIEAYERTHGDSPALGDLEPYEGRNTSRRAPAAAAPSQRHAAVPAVPNAAGGTLLLTSYAGTPESAYPVSMTAAEVAADESAYRRPATVMRVWINAWEDEEGTLHLPQKVFSEVEPRKWTVGDKAPVSATNFRLLESANHSAKDSQAVAPKQGVERDARGNSKS